MKMDNIFNFIFGGGATRGIMERRNQSENGKVLRTEVNDFIIDSCYTFDAGYETAICKNNGDWIIVERYSTFGIMEVGHKKWCKFCETNPSELYSVQFDKTVQL